MAVESALVLQRAICHKILQQRRLHRHTLREVTSTADRDQAVHKIRSAKLKAGWEDAWAKPDLPIEIRAPQGIVFGAKKLLVERDIPKYTVWADPDEYTLHMGDDEVLRAQVQGNELKVIFGHAWEDYLNEDGRWQKLLEMHAEKLQKGKATKAAGKGKSKSGKSGGSSR